LRELFKEELQKRVDYIEKIVKEVGGIIVFQTLSPL